MALVVAIGVLLVVAVLTLGVASIALTAKRQSTQGRNAIGALASAESGISLATAYLNQAMPLADGECPGQLAGGVVAKTVAADTTLHPTKGYGGRCGPYISTLPDGSTVSIVVSGGTTYRTGVASGSLACAGAQVNAPTRPGLTIHQRCVTASGTFGGVTRRIQARVVSASYIFPIPGIVGIQGVKIGQGAGSTLSLAECANPAALPSGTSLVMASIGTNGSLTTSLNCWVGDPSDVQYGNSSRLYLGQGRPATTSSGVPNPSITGAQPGGIVELGYKLSVPTLDPLFQAGADGVTDTSLAGGNHNLIGLHLGTGCSGPAYTSATRILSLPNNGCVVTLDGSNDVEHPRIYNFCQITLPNSGELTVTDPVANPYVQVYLDSSARLRSDGTAACPAGPTGTLTMGNGSGILANATSSLGAQIFIYGTADALGTGTNNISWRNGADVKMLLAAPRAKIAFQNGGRITGGVATYEVQANNNMQFIWDRDVDKVQRRALFYRTAFAECTTVAPDATDPHSGC